MPDDIILQILSKLPVKSLYRFKSVSKKWLDWITSDAWFKEAKAHQSLQCPRLISFEIKGSGETWEVGLITTDLGCGKIVDKFQLSVASRSEQPFIQVTSCRDLVCLFSDVDIVVCNPSNRGLIRFKNHGLNSPNCVGIGYGASSNLYKLVALFPKSVDGLARIGFRIFTIKENSQVDNVFSNVANTLIFQPSWSGPLDNLLPICVNGIMYWMMKNPPNIAAYYLDLDKYEFGTVRFPKLIIEDKIFANLESMKFVELQGWLCLECDRPLTSTLAFYALKDVKSGIWEMLYQISISAIVDRPGTPHVLSVTSRDASDGDIVISYIKSGLENIYLYNSRDGGLKKVELSYQPKGQCSFLYFDSMFVLKKNSCYVLPV